MMWLTLEEFSGTKSLVMRPFQPRRMPMQLMPRLMEPLTHRVPDHGPDRRVHARRVAAAGEDADSLYLFLHNKTLLTNFTGRARFAPGRRSAVEQAGRQPIFSCIP